LAAERGSTVVWLSHDLQAVARWCDRVAVMTEGRVVEEGPAGQVLTRPEHEYTRRLVAADPRRARLADEDPFPGPRRNRPRANQPRAHQH
jgi:ABC-type dipeptide/oligopeptide/nickel transport system ATPase component